MQLPKQITFSLVISFVLLFVFGCEEYEYLIEMTPVENGLQRKINCMGDFQPEQLKRISELYNNKKIAGNHFIGVFEGKLPDDVGGAGFYSRISTEMGTAHTYSERFGGKDDLKKTIGEISDSVNKIVNFFCGWLDYEFGHDPDLNKLRDFCQNRLRYDAENFALNLWLCKWQAEIVENESSDFTMQLIHHLIEHDYIELSDIYNFNDSNNNEQSKKLICKILAKKSGLTEEIVHKKFNRFFDEKIFEKSLNSYYKTTSIYKQLWEKKKLEESDPNTEPPDFDDFIEDEIKIHFNIWSPVHKIQVVIKCTEEPFETNGDWDANDLKLTWSGTVNDNIIIPLHVYCFWSNPDKAFQQEHFGKIILSNQALTEYCAWQANLDEGKAKQWSQFLKTLKPDDSLKSNIEKFYFSDEKPTKAGRQPKDSAKKVRELLLGGL
ncbi:MAG: hypothetical protein JW804_00615 [Sedimentisphaerales bacterium]|nr:hypothetical protein [Sedimentisphaerales bacterium]